MKYNVVIEEVIRIGDLVELSLRDGCVMPNFHSREIDSDVLDRARGNEVELVLRKNDFDFFLVSDIVSISYDGGIIYPIGKD